MARVAIARAASRGGPTYVSLARQCTDDLLKAAAGFHAEVWRLAETADLLDGDVDQAQAKRLVDDGLERLLGSLASLRCHVILADSPERTGRHRSSIEQQQQQQISRQSTAAVALQQGSEPPGSLGSFSRRPSPARSDSMSFGTLGSPSRHQSPGAGSRHSLDNALTSTATGQRAMLFVPKPTSSMLAATPDASTVTTHCRESVRDSSADLKFLSLPVWSPSSDLTRDVAPSSRNTTKEAHGTGHLAGTNTMAPFHRATSVMLPLAFREYLADQLLKSSVDVDLSSQIRSMEHSSIDFGGQLLKRANACLEMAFSVGPRDGDQERRRAIGRLRVDVASLTPHVLLGLQSLHASGSVARADDGQESLTLVHAWCRAINALEVLCDDCLKPYLTYSNKIVNAALQHNPELLRVETRGIETVHRTAAVLGDSVLKSCGSLHPFSSGGSEYILQQLERIHQLTKDLANSAHPYASDYSSVTGSTTDVSRHVNHEKRSQRQALVALSRAWALAVFDLISRVIELCDDYMSSTCTLGGLDYSNCVKETEEARALLEISLDQPTADQQQQQQQKLVSKGETAMAACQAALAALSLDESSERSSSSSSLKPGLGPDCPAALFAHAHHSARLCAWYRSLEGVHEAIDSAINGVCRPLHELFYMATHVDVTLATDKARQVYQEQMDLRLTDLADDLDFAMLSVEDAAKECQDVALKMASKSCILTLKSTDALEKAFGGCVKHTSSRLSLVDRGLCKRSFRQLVCLVTRLRTTIHRLLQTPCRHSAILKDAFRRIDGSCGASSEASFINASTLPPDIMAAASKLLGGGYGIDSMLSDFLRSENQKTIMSHSTAETSSTKNKLTAHRPLAAQSSETARHGVAAVKVLLSKLNKQQSSADSEQAYMDGSSQQKWEDDSLPVVNAAKQMTKQLHEITRLARLGRLGSEDQQRLLNFAREMSANSETVLQLARALLHDTPELRQATKADLLVDCTRAETIATQLQMSTSVRSASIDEAETRKLIAHNARELMASTFEAVKNAEAVFIEACGKVSLDSRLELEALKPALTWMQQLKEHRHTEGRRIVVTGNGVSDSSSSSNGKIELNELGLRKVSRNYSGPELCEIFKRR